MGHAFAILDSNVYIDHWRTNRWKANFELAQHRFILRQCSVVLHELRRGASSREDIGLTENLLRYSPEIINPLDTDWWRAAQILQKALTKQKFSPSRLKNLQNDCLIAFCSRRIGGVVITSDKKDFKVLEGLLPCKILYW